MQMVATAPGSNWCDNIKKWQNRWQQGNGRCVALDDDNVTQSETALTNQLIAVVNSVGNEAFVDEMKKKDCVAATGSGKTDRQQPF